MKLSKKQQLQLLTESAKMAFSRANANIEREYHIGCLSAYNEAIFCVSGAYSNEISELLNGLLAEDITNGK